MSKHILFKGKKIHYSRQGKGKTIVLIHGFLESHSLWKQFVRKLSPDFNVLAIDLPGHGDSEVIQDVHSMDIMAEAINEVLKELGIHTCVMVGHSMGGYVTLAFAEKYPKKLKGFTLFHSQAAADTPEAQDNRDRTIQIVRQDKKGFIKHFIPDLFDPDNVSRCQDEIAQMKAAAAIISKEAIIAALEGMKIRPDRTHILAHSAVPIQFIIGKNDERIPMHVIIPQTLLPQHAEVILLDKVGHIGIFESKHDTLQAVRHFAMKVMAG